MAIDTVVNSIKLDDWADNGKVPVYNNTTKEFDMTTPWGVSSTLDVTQTAHWFVTLDWLYFDSWDGLYKKAQANAETTIGMRHVVEVVDANNIKIAKDWTHTISNALALWDWVLSPTTAWGYTQTIPTTSWQYILYGMEVLSSTEVSFYSVIAIQVSIYNWLLNFPEGTMINGKIERTVASNNLTFSLKTMDWSNPSVSNPVYCRIWNDLRAITAPLSNTLNAWTNRYESWSAELATNEVDYFVYLWRTTVYNTVYIQPSRIPYATTRANFSSTTTNERYAPNAWDMNTTDPVVVVWRFNATLSAWASFNRSIPATDIVINRPIYETRRIPYTPAITWDGTAPTSLLWSRFRYKISWDTCSISVAIDYNTAWTSNSIVTCTIPISEKAIYYTSWLNALLCIWTWSWYWVWNASTCQMRWGRLVRIIWNSINANTFAMSWSYEIV